MYVCMYVCMFMYETCKYVCMHACMHVCMYAKLHVYIGAYTCIRYPYVHESVQKRVQGIIFAASLLEVRAKRVFEAKEGQARTVQVC